MIGSQVPILVVNGHPVVREGMKALIATQPDMTVAGEADSMKQAKILFELFSPGVTKLVVRTTSRGPRPRSARFMGALWLAVFYSLAVAAENTWMVEYGSGGGAVTSVVSAGSSNGAVLTLQSGGVVITDALGNVVETIQTPGPAWCVQATSDGGFVAAGGSPAWVMKIDQYFSGTVGDANDRRGSCSPVNWGKHGGFLRDWKRRSLAVRARGWP